MPKSTAEKMWEYRAPTSEEKHQEMCNKIKEHQKASRSKWSEARGQLESEKAKERVKNSGAKMTQTNEDFAKPNVAIIKACPNIQILYISKKTTCI